MEVYVFSRHRVENETLDDGEGGEVSLDEHMDYVLNCGGTPDCIDILRGTISEIVDQMEKYRNYAVFVDQDGDRII